MPVPAMTQALAFVAMPPQSVSYLGSTCFENVPVLLVALGPGPAAAAPDARPRLAAGRDRVGQAVVVIRGGLGAERDGAATPAIVESTGARPIAARAVDRGAAGGDERIRDDADLALVHLRLLLVRRVISRFTLTRFFSAGRRLVTAAERPPRRSAASTAGCLLAGRLLAAAERPPGRAAALVAAGASSPTGAAPRSAGLRLPPPPPPDHSLPPPPAPPPVAGSVAGSSPPAGSASPDAQLCPPPPASPESGGGGGP